MELSRNILLNIISSINVKVIIINLVCMLGMTLISKINHSSIKTISILKLVLSISCFVGYLYTLYLLFMELPYELRQALVILVFFIPIVLLATLIYMWMVK